MTGRCRRRIGWALLFVTALTVIAGVALLRTPSWWSPVAAENPAALEAGENFENACISESHRVRPENQPWAVRVRDAEVNAWLATRLPKWVEHLGALRPGAAQVRFTEGTIELATEIAGLPSIASLRIAPVVANGAISLGRQRVAVGRFPLPVAHSLVIAPLVRSLGGSDAPDELQLAIALLGGQAIKAEFELADGRVVRVRDIEVHDGEMLLEFETAPPARRR
ncbi:MAG: hypothetical protein SGJ09_03420 [Phycisphaerae bacterium]|nr:hypothetical protein [Phycisphaerae bacterium]